MILLGSAVVFTVAPALAGNAKPVHPQTTCSVTPGSKNSGSTKNRKDRSSDLTNKLSSCGGVLKPPAVGDDMAKPAPKTGSSRIIKPKDLPGQQSPGAPKRNED
jgi:hypothetical protein